MCHVLATADQYSCLIQAAKKVFPSKIAVGNSVLKMIRRRELDGHFFTICARAAGKTGQISQESGARRHFYQIRIDSALVMFHSPHDECHTWSHISATSHKLRDALREGRWPAVGRYILINCGTSSWKFSRLIYAGAANINKFGCEFVFWLRINHVRASDESVMLALKCDGQTAVTQNTTHPAL